MLVPIARRLVVLAGLAVAAISSVGCYVDLPPPEHVEEGYQPLYYDGYLVYFDEAGRPYYYAGGRVLWIPSTDPLYASFVAHYRAYQPAYHRWYSRGGFRYRTYRRR